MEEVAAKVQKVGCCPEKVVAVTVVNIYNVQKFIEHLLFNEK